MIAGCPYVYFSPYLYPQSLLVPFSLTSYFKKHIATYVAENPPESPCCESHGLEKLRALNP